MHRTCVGPVGSIRAKQVWESPPSIRACSSVPTNHVRVRTSRVVHTGLVENLQLASWMLVKVTAVGMVLTLEEGAYNTLWATTTKKENLRNGEFYEPVGIIGRQAAMARNEQVAGELWTWLERELDGYLSRS
jgi:hypothetical protein